jgi:hypothetical protein
MPLDVRRGLLRFLRPREISYVSLETKLSEAGVISQITTVLTCMTTGSPGWFETPWGAIEFTHTDRSIRIGTDVIAQDDGTFEATLRTAVRDLRRVGRNLDLIDDETLAEVIIEEEDRHEQQGLRRSRIGETEIQGIAVMAKKNPHLGLSFESWLDEAGIREEVTAAAIKAVIARQLASEMKKKGISKPKMAELMKTSRAQIDRLLDPDNGSATIETLQRAARIVGRELRLQLV